MMSFYNPRFAQLDIILFTTRHNKGKTRTYGNLFKEGDTIGITLNMDLGTLSFSHNGSDLGVAVEGLSGEVSVPDLI